MPSKQSARRPRTARSSGPRPPAPGPAARRPLIVTIDGPAGSGKSTTAKLLAKALGLTYLDTGATYRTLAHAAIIQGGIDTTDVPQLVEIARHLPLRLRMGRSGVLRVELDGADVTKAIRTEEVSEAAAIISQYPGVRAAMVKRQRELADQQGVVVEGRDTGSVVFPNAPHKFFLGAAPAIRAKRRQREMARMYGSKPPLAQIREQLHFRDGLDRTRRIGALVKPKGAIAIETSHRTAHQVVQLMRRHIHRRTRS